MWYQLRVDIKKGKYKIIEAPKFYSSFLREIEQKAKEEKNIMNEVIYYNTNCYFAQNKKALERKAEELGNIYFDILKYLDQIDEESVKKLIQEINELKQKREQEIDGLVKRINIRHGLKKSIFENFINSSSD